MRMQAQAALHFARGQTREAARLAADLRQRYPAETDLTRTQWMRPWMLSLLLARKAGDATAEAEPAVELGELGSGPPLSLCHPRPAENNLPRAPRPAPGRASPLDQSSCP